MSFFILPQAWITPAIMAAVMAFGPVDGTTQIRYHRFAGSVQAVAQPPATIFVDKRRSWDRRQAQCVLAHEYGHLAGRKHSERGLMARRVSYQTCVRWLRRHGVA